ncbi:hypothetical protein D8B26_000263 [Coccidioides posadasii str. Silveira]|uniref:Uncharacterized protein n=1 Tax=Coccidioides posadasii (strain RMSCC 757 / Silveira) TaxID=443226 RepID=E9D854_COCPS|nr:conserved hypothetical protein [Coccidioides posadasii str. Silveira]QVM05558.1 hypothetical protein D8B26_000263 [Coccidioides posadasii str. Silveira]
MAHTRYPSLTSRRRRRTLSWQQHLANQASREANHARTKREPREAEGYFRPPAELALLFPKETSDKEEESQRDKNQKHPFDHQERSTNFGSHSTPLPGPSNSHRERPQASRIDFIVNELLARHKSWSNPGSSPIIRPQDSSLSAVTRTGEALIRFLEKEPNHVRTKSELREYEACRAKLDNNQPLNGAEKERMGTIMRNVQRREYALNKKVAQISQAKISPEDSTATPTGFEQKIAEPTPFKKATSSETIAEEKYTQNEHSTSDDDADADSGEHSDQDEESCFFRYHVYLTDNATGKEPFFLRTYLNKAKAEARVRKEIANVYRSVALEDRTGVELRSVIKDDMLHGQCLDFESGRSVQVQIEPELVENEELPRKKRRKLEYLPNKVYIVVEHVGLLNQLTPAHSAEEADGFPALPRQAYGKEGFALRKLANKQASREMMAYLTNHLSEAEKFDVSVTGRMDTEERRYLHELEQGERLYDRNRIVVDRGGRALRVSVKVVEILVRCPRN